MTTLGSLSNRRLTLAVASLMLTPGLAVAQIKRFQIEEASIASIQSAIKSGQTTCRAVVQAYMDRGKGLQRSMHRAHYCGRRARSRRNRRCEGGLENNVPHNNGPCNKSIPQLQRVCRVAA